MRNIFRLARPSANADEVQFHVPPIVQTLIMLRHAFHGFQDCLSKIEDKFVVGSDLHPRERDRLFAFLFKHQDIFAASDRDLKLAKGASLDIDTGDTPPISLKVRRVPYQLREEIEKEIAAGSVSYG